MELWGGFGWLCPASQGSKFGVRGSKFDVHYKHSEYDCPFPPPSRWSGGTLVLPWTYPIPVEHPQSPLFNQARLSKSLSCGSSTMKRASKFDVRCSMFGPRLACLCTPAGLSPQATTGPYTYEPCGDVDPRPDYENVLTD